MYRKVFKRKINIIEPEHLQPEIITIIPRDKHTISRKNISDNALKVLYRLQRSGHEAYLVGGGVRDLLIGQKPKDFDIVTNATPEQIRRLFRNCRLVGRRFRLAHIIFGKEIIEVATFRGEHCDDHDKNQSQQSNNGLLLRDNVYGTIEQDALRRDFTINSLYYSSADFSLRDYCNGLHDLQLGIIRLIGDPETRYREDPVRMLRAVRFVAKLNMTIEPRTEEPIIRLSGLLQSIPAPRLFEETLKLLQSGQGYKSYKLLRKYHLFEQLLPIISRHFTPEGDSNMECMLIKALKSTDQRIAEQKRVNPAFLFAAILWYPLLEQAEKLTQEGGLSYSDAFSLAINDTLDESCLRLAIPKRITTVIRDIWQIQLRLLKRDGRRAFRLLEQPKFRAGFDLLVLRAEIEKGELAKIAQWWNDFQHANHDQQKVLINDIARKQTRYRSRKPRQVNKRPYNKTETKVKK